MRFLRGTWSDGIGKGMAMKRGWIVVVALLVVCVPLAVTASTPGDFGATASVASGLDTQATAVSQPMTDNPPDSPDMAATPLPTPVLVPLAVPTVVPTMVPAPTPSPTPTPNPMTGVPLRLRIPSIGVDAAVEIVRLDGDGSVGTPKNFADVGWYELGARPGEPGNSVIVGHVDSTTGAAVFWDLHKLQPGDRVSVVGDDGTERSFIVRGSQRFGHDDAPLDKIYGNADGSHLNLVTCDSDTPFNRRTGEYGGYVVVFADADPAVVAQ